MKRMFLAAIAILVGCCVLFLIVFIASGGPQNVNATNTAKAISEVTEQAAANATASIIALTPTDTPSPTDSPTITPTSSKTPVPTETPMPTRGVFNKRATRGNFFRTDEQLQSG